MILLHKARIFILAMQVFPSVIVASFAVKEGIPYIGIGPPWWQSALSRPWSLAIKFGGIAHPLLVEALHCLLSKTTFTPGRRETVS
jgi:hypothetical protein